jgi:hypothetical protein
MFRRMTVSVQDLHAHVGAAALAFVPSIASAASVDSRAVERTLLAVFAGFVIVVALLGLAPVAALGGRHRRRLLRFAIAVESTCALAAVAGAIVAGSGRDFSRLEHSILVAGALFLVVCIALVIHAFAASRSAGV